MNALTNSKSSIWNSLDIINIQIAADKFTRLNWQARVVNVWNRLTGRPSMLLTYEDMSSQSTNNTTRLDRGIKEIPVKSIVGSFNRAEDYDGQFRPLNPALKDRWINIYMLSEQVGWEPITVYKIGFQYFVKDGHHRVSVARHLGWDYIEAQVYE